MLQQLQQDKLFSELVGSLELPSSAYDLANKRYQHLGNWLGRVESTCARFQPLIFPQGSFRIGTAIHPYSPADGYDLDLGCSLEFGISTNDKTQKELKELVGNEIEKYRIFSRGQKEVKEKHRCWCLNYQDDLSFHIDIVPCIPAHIQSRAILKKSLMSAGTDSDSSDKVASSAILITDDRLANYSQLSNDWLVSNPIGYANWFEMRMMEDMRISKAHAAKIDQLPMYERKTPLQQAVQLLKRHRDIMFKNHKDMKPISIIITTLAARAYGGEGDLPTATLSILNKMDSFIASSGSRIPNPVNPEEDFADKWSMPKYAELRLEDNFTAWLTQARIDMDALISSDDMEFTSEYVGKKFSVMKKASDLRDSLDLKPITAVAAQTRTIEKPPKPWSN